MNIVDFHIHGIGSNYKDDFATASYDQICAYFENYAQKLKHNVVIVSKVKPCLEKYPRKAGMVTKKPIK